MENIKIRNKNEYVSFGNRRIQFDLSKNTVLIGENGIGKTRTLEFINSVSTGVVPELDKYGVVETSFLHVDEFEKNSRLFYEMRRYHLELLSVISSNKIGSVLTGDYNRLHTAGNEILLNVKPKQVGDITINDFEDLAKNKDLGSMEVELFVSFLYAYIPEKKPQKNLMDAEYLYKNFIFAVMDFIDTRIRYNERIDKESQSEILHILRKINIGLRNVKTRKRNIKFMLDNKFNCSYLSTARISKRYLQHFVEQEFDEMSGKKGIEEKLFYEEISLEEIESLKYELNNKISILNSYLNELGTNIVLKLNRGNFTLLKNGDTVALTSFSSGEKSILLILINLIFLSDTLILIDEIELSFTFDWQLKILAIISDLAPLTGNNVLITTHSALVVKQIDALELFELVVC